MRIEEAVWIEGAISKNLPKVAAGHDAIVLNLGSGTLKAREVGKPYVQRNTIEPLVQTGYRVVHSDLLAGDGIDLSGDMFNPEFQSQLRELGPRVMMFCNVFEHLDAGLRARTPGVIDSILSPGGYLLVTVPHSYPYHADPIDTMYRPDPEEVSRLFPSYEPVQMAVVDSETFGDEFGRGNFWRRMRKVLRLLSPFVRPRRWLSHAHRFFWMNKPYRISCVLLRKPG